MKTFLDGRVTLHGGDCLEVVKGLADNSIDSVCTDPPYALVSIGKRFGKDGAAPAKPGTVYARASAGFMQSRWDVGDVAFSADFWSEIYRVLKPGGHVAAFGGTRTYHRLACAIEDAGFEIRDCIFWCFGVGFPKSLDVSKQIDKAAPRVGMFAPFADHYGERRAAVGLTHNQICEAGKFYAEHNHGGASSNWEKGFNVPTSAQWQVLQPLLGLSDAWADLIARVEAERERVGERKSGDPTAWYAQAVRGDGIVDVTLPATDAARQWEGWGTALKPAVEPITLARKPLSEKTVAANVLRWGTGAINVDGCRVGTEGATRKTNPAKNDSVNAYGNGLNGGGCETIPGLGRFPANLCHDGSDEVLAAFPETKSGQPLNRMHVDPGRNVASGASEGGTYFHTGFGDTGSAARFFYSAKASKADRALSKHPTVKPVKLMQWLVRLITPPNGKTLDPFAGTGTTGEAAWREGFSAVLIEREEEYQADIERRMLFARAKEKPDTTKRAQMHETLPLPLAYDVAFQATLAAE